MAIPIIPLDETAPRLDDDTLLQIISDDARKLTNSLDELDNYRDYYEGVQELNFATDEFIDAFGEQFNGFRSNWMGVIIEAMEERLDIQRIRFRSEDGNPEEDLNDSIWNVLLQNELEQLQNDTYNGGLVESRGYIIVWPDDEMGARVDYQPAQNVWATYHPDDSRTIDRAIKRWVTPDGGQRLTLYTRDFLYKYKVEATSNQDPEEIQPSDTGWIPVETADSGDPSWPLPNPFGEVPMVEFWNRGHKSELRDVIPLQDALNKTLRDMMVSNEYSAQQIIYLVTSNEEPEGGWVASPGTVWHVQPEQDFEGNVLPTTVGSIQGNPPDGFISSSETYLQHIAAISRTPAHYFYLSSKQGGRGDAPSGEALRVAETGLLKKIQKLQALWGLRWMRVGRLIGMALSSGSDILLLGETVWTHPMAHFQSLLLEEGRMMIDDLGLPPEMAWRHFGLSEEEIAEASAIGFDDDPGNQDSDTESSSSDQQPSSQGGQGDQTGQ